MNEDEIEEMIGDTAGKLNAAGLDNSKLKFALVAILAALIDLNVKEEEADAFIDEVARLTKEWRAECQAAEAAEREIPPRRM